MSRETLTAAHREASGSPVARRLRKTGQVPGILYQHGETPISFAASEHETTKLLRRGATLIDLDIGGKKHTTVIKDYQVHAVRGNLVHIDMQEVRMDEMLSSTVGVQLVGEPVGAKEGGVLSQAVHELNIESTPGNIPEYIDVDVSGLGVGDSLPLSAVTAPEGVRFTDDLETTVLASVAIPAEEPVEEVPVEGAEGAAGEAPDGEGAGDAGAGDSE